MSVIYNAKPGQKINEETYWHFLEVLPPAYMDSSLFLMGEPFDHILEGARYGGYVKVNGNYYYLGLLTKKQAKDRQYVMSIIRGASND